MIPDTKPTWLYKPVHIDNLENIQIELSKFIYSIDKDFDTKSTDFIFVTKFRMASHTPLLCKLIRSMGLFSRWIGCGISSNNHGENLRIHVDQFDWTTVCYGLNIPVMNCEDSYTVWYDAELLDENPSDDKPAYNNAPIIKPGTTPIEIGRWAVKNPAWVNVSIPHCSVTEHNKPRALISARFDPEVHDLLNK